MPMLGQSWTVHLQNSEGLATFTIQPVIKGPAVACKLNFSHCLKLLYKLLVVTKGDSEK